MVDVGLRQCRQAGADGRRHQHIDFRKDLCRERLEDRAATAERLDVVGRRDGVAGVHPAADMLGVDVRVSAHPFGVDRSGLGPGDDATEGGDGVEVRQGEPADVRASLGQDCERGFHRREDRCIRAVEKVVGRHADPQPAQVAIHGGLVVGHRLGRAGRIERILSGNHAQNPSAVASGASEGADIVVGEGERHDTVARDAGLCRFQSGHSARRGGKPDRSACVGSQSHVVEARRDGGA
jgi:hypothetical protein